MEFSNRIRSLRFEKNLTQKYVSQKLGVSEVSVSCWENGTKAPSMKAIVALASLFDVSADYLLGISDESKKREPPPLNRREAILLCNYRNLDCHGRKAVETICLLEKSRIESELNNVTSQKEKSPSRYIPRYSTPSAAGYSVPLDGDDFEMILVDDTVPTDADFAVGIQGNSMLPYIHDGDTVYVKKDCDLSVGDIGIFCVDGAMYCKQYYVDNERNLILVSANPQLKNTNVFVSADSASEVRCYGKVLLGCKVDLPKYLLLE